MPTPFRHRRPPLLQSAFAMALAISLLHVNFCHARVDCKVLEVLGPGETHAEALARIEAEIRHEAARDKPNHELLRHLRIQAAAVYVAMARAKGTPARAPANRVTGAQQALIDGLRGRELSMDYTMTGVRVNDAGQIVGDPSKAKTELKGKLKFVTTMSRTEDGDYTATVQIFFETKWLNRDTKIVFGQFVRSFDPANGTLTLENAKVNQQVTTYPGSLTSLQSTFSLPSKVKVDVPGNPFPNQEVPVQMLGTMLLLANLPPDKAFKVGSLKHVYISQIVNKPTVIEHAILQDALGANGKDVDLGPFLADSRSVEYTASMLSLLGSDVTAVRLNRSGSSADTFEHFMADTEGRDGEIDAVFRRYGRSPSEFRGRTLDTKFTLVLDVAPNTGPAATKP